MEIVDLLSDEELFKSSKSPDQILQGAEGGMKAKAVHEQLRRQTFLQSSSVSAGYEEAESSGNATPVSINTSVLPFLVSQFNGLSRTQPLAHQFCEFQACSSAGWKPSTQVQN